MTDDLFDWSQVTRKLPSGSTVRTKKHLEYRKPLPTRKVKRVDQVVTDIIVDNTNGTCEVYYYMAKAKDREIQPPYRVPVEQLEFIADAIDEGLIPNKPVWIDVEVDERNRNVWLRIEEK